MRTQVYLCVCVRMCVCVCVCVCALTRYSGEGVSKSVALLSRVFITIINHERHGGILAINPTPSLHILPKSTKQSNRQVKRGGGGKGQPRPRPNTGTRMETRTCRCLHETNQDKKNQRGLVLLCRDAGKSRFFGRRWFVTVRLNILFFFISIYLYTES